MYATTTDTVYAMMDYAQSSQCRRKLFAQYFDELGDTSPCGACDNCERGLLAQLVDVSFAAWKVVCATEQVYRANGRVTLTGLADLVRGLHQAQFRQVDSRGAPSSKSQLDLASLGGKVLLSREVCMVRLRQDTERLIVELLLRGYLAESYRMWALLIPEATAYTVHVYIIPGGRASLLSVLSLEDATTLSGKVSIVLQAPASKKPKLVQ